MPAAGRPARLYVALVGVFVAIVATHVAASRVAPSLADGITIGLATCVIVALMRRWRVVVPDHGAQLERIEAQLNLAHVLGDVYLPFNGWAMEPVALMRLLSSIQVEGYESIVEFGSGLSTLAIARVLSQRGRGRLTSFEEDERWCELVRSIIAREELGEFAEVVHAPLEPFEGGEGGEGYDGASWYALGTVEPALAKVGHADLVLVDGPISRHAMSRYPALPVLAQLGVVDATTSIVLDDAGREHERAVLGRWRRELGADVELLGDTERGQALVRLSAGARNGAIGSEPASN